MRDPVIFQKLMDVSLRFVSFRPRSKKELRDALIVACKKRQVTDFTIVDDVLTRLGELGYADDTAFAKWWIMQRKLFRPKGWRVLAFELQQKGVSRDVIERIRQETEHTASLDEDKGATQLVHKMMGKWAHLPQKQAKMKLYAYLQRRGFDASLIARAVDEIMKTQYNTDAT